jgi:hypothetical protein
MNVRRCINPSSVALYDAEPYFYPIANTPTVDLCEDIPVCQPGTLEIFFTSPTNGEREEISAE